MNSKHAGWHVCIDAHVDPKFANLLNDQEYLRLAVVDLIHVLDMELLAGPFVKAVTLDHNLTDSPHDEGGVSVMTMITTSHLSIHAWPLRSRFSMDIFSCKRFLDTEVDHFVRQRLHVTKRWLHSIPRLWTGPGFGDPEDVVPASLRQVPERTP